MKVINSGFTFRIQDDSMKVYSQLPSQPYQVCFSPQSGWYLQKYDMPEISEKIYGVHPAKVQKVLSAFSRTERNLGVILSGAKGIGKSLFAKLLSHEAVKLNLPLIIVTSYIPGIADFLASIQQEVVVLFDEFDKTFCNGHSNDAADPQSEMLTLFDGLSAGKKLFIITCNELRGLNDYLVNRPGRFHYHLRFEYPTDAEIREYFTDKLDPKYYGEIDKVVSFAQRVPLNFDCMRAIAFELSSGLPFEEAVLDLNIVRQGGERYICTVLFDDGTRAKREVTMDLFDEREYESEFADQDNFGFYVAFNTEDAAFDVESGRTVIPGNKLSINWEDDYYNETEDDRAKLAIRKARKPVCMMIRRKVDPSIHYHL